MRAVVVCAGLACCTPFAAANDVPADAMAEASAAPDAGADAAVAPVAFVQAGATMSANKTSLSLPFEQPLKVGNAVVVASTTRGVDAPVITDSDGTKYATVASISRGNLRHTISFNPHVRGGSTTVTVTFPTVSPEILLYIHEYSGLVAFDVGDAANGSGETMETPDVKTTTDHELLFAFGTAGTASVGDGFKARSTMFTNITEDMIVETAGDYRATAKADSDWSLLVAAFKNR